MSRLIERAQAIAYELHVDDLGNPTLRKHYELPYTVHLERVVGYVKAALHQNPDLLESGDCWDEIIAAAYTHDLLEDTKYIYNDMVIHLNKTIADLVKDLTNVEKSAGNRAARKKIDNERLDKAHKYVKIIKLADRLDNINDLIVSYFKGDITEQYFVMYMEETEELLKYIKVDECCLYKRLKDLVSKNIK
jgi:(p)ppGpp synthase/HD superfamily hydrolase